MGIPGPEVFYTDPDPLPGFEKRVGKRTERRFNEDTQIIEKKNLEEKLWIITFWK
jgi:hypothetical protein